MAQESSKKEVKTFPAPADLATVSDLTQQQVRARYGGCKSIDSRCVCVVCEDQELSLASVRFSLS